MRRTALVLTAAALVIGAATLGAQTPNFAGMWTRISDSSASATGGGGAPDALTIVQDAKTLTVTMQAMGNDVTFVYNLDGTDSKKQMMDGNGNPSEIVARSKWDGSKLVVTMTRDSDAPVTFAYSLEAAGHLALVVTLPPRGGGDPVTRTSSYKKN